jgi:hypothetical protein
VQFRFFTALIVFIGSYLPLSLILLAQNFDFAAVGGRFCWPMHEGACALPIKSPMFSIGLFALTLMCFGATLVALRAIRPSIDVDVLEAEYVPTDLMNYTLPYVVSFMSIDYQETGKFIGFLVFLVWMFWITYRAGQVILNPVLIAMGWRLYTISYRFAGSQNVFKTSALSKGYLTPGGHKQYPLQEIQIMKPKESA